MWYIYYSVSACYRNEDEGVMIAVASDDLWDDGAACGSFVHRPYKPRSAPAL
jgi:hypothetical protein